MQRNALERSDTNKRGKMKGVNHAHLDVVDDTKHHVDDGGMMCRKSLQHVRKHVSGKERDHGTRWFANAAGKPENRMILILHNAVRNLHAERNMQTCTVFASRDVSGWLDNTSRSL